MISSVELFYAGYCTHPEIIVIAGGKLKPVKFPAVFALIRHEKLGNILFDTGYSERFYDETKRFPFSLYAKTTPVYLTTGESAKQILDDKGIAAHEINYIIISHFHADHIGGLKDFPNAKYIYNNSAYQKLKSLSGLKLLLSGYLVGLIPQNFANRSLMLKVDDVVDLPKTLAPFTKGYDIFGDGSIMLVALPGHARGQLGALITTSANEQYFLVGDAVWRSDSYKQMKLPSVIAKVIMHDNEQYVETIRKLNKLHVQNPALKIIPSHCLAAFEDVSK